jgi:hypothetical protein
MLKQLPLIINYVSKSIYNNNHWKNAIWWGGETTTLYFYLALFSFSFFFFGCDKIQEDLCVQKPN